MKSNKYENLKSLENRKTKDTKKRNLEERISFKGKKKDDIRYKGKRIEDRLLKSKTVLDKILSKTPEDSISLEKLKQIKTKKIYISISPFEIKFPFDYFFSSLMPVKVRHPSFGGASPGNYTLFSSLLFSSLLFSSLLFSSFLF